MAWVVKFRDESLERLERSTQYDGGYSPGICRVFRRRMQFIRAATDERDFYALKSLHFEKLKGKRSHQHSMKLNEKWRLIIEISTEGKEKILVVCGIEDYH